MDIRATTSLLLLLLLGLCSAQLPDENGDNEISADVPDTKDISDIILQMNNGSSNFLIEGDVLIPKTRSAMKCYSETYSCRWPQSSSGNVEIPYVISNSYEYSETLTILNALKDFEYKTCLRFIPRTSQRVYLSFEPRRGCFSLLGRIGDKQVVSLQRFGCIQHGIIQHEVMHALGFYHEQSRSDRDKYVKINWENTYDFFKHNFQKKETINLGTPYDYGSVMHYGRRAFGKNGAETITPIPDSTVAIGQRDGLSNIDVLRINILYKCWDKLMSDSM